MTQVAKRFAWTVEADKLLAALYLRAPWADILAAFPGVTKRAIWNHAFRLNLKREIKEDPPGFREAHSKRLREKPIRLGKVIYPIIERDGIPGKFCSKCSAWKSLDEYGKKPDCSGGVRNICGDCEWQNNKARQARSPESRAKAVANVRRYQKNNPEKAAATRFAGKKRRYERMMEGAGVSGEQLTELRALWGGLCAYCAAEATSFDHVVPIARGGQHAFENLVPACKPCNFSKHAKLLDEWRPGIDLTPRKVR